MNSSALQLLRILQELSQARIRLGCGQLAGATAVGSTESPQALAHRIAHGEQRALRLLASLSADQRSEVVLARALFLKLLLESAPKRLQGWSDQDPLDRMPPSRLFEWISHDHEQLELSQLESQMSPEEAARYVNALHAD